MGRSGLMGIGDDLGDGLGHVRAVLPVDVVGAREVGGAQGGAESVGEIGEIARGDEGVPQRLLLLFREGQQGGLGDDSRLDPPGDSVVRTRAARPATVFGRAAVGASPFRVAMSVGVWAAAWSESRAQRAERCRTSRMCCLLFQVVETHGPPA